MEYTVEEKTLSRLANDYTYHPPKPDQIPRYEEIRDTGYRFAFLIARLTPPSREQSVALTLLEQVVMEANAAIARNEK